MEIEDKPSRPVCSVHGPLRWGWFTDTKQGARWVSFTHETVGVFGAVLVPHVCDDPGQPAVRWEPSETVAATARRGAHLARQVLAGANPFTEVGSDLTRGETA
jgi:hypothetical protein